MGVVSGSTVQMVVVVCLVYPLAFLSGYISRPCNKNIMHGATPAQLPKQKNSTQSGTSEGTMGSELSTRIEFLNAGLCPVQGCNISREIREVWSHHADAAKEARSDPLNEFATVEMARDGGKKFRMLTRDPKKDKFISASIRGGRLWDPMVRKPLIQAIKGQQSMPVFIDIGANVGYFTHTALAMGARVISFEPMRANMGPLMATIEENKWQDRWTGYHNAVSFEPSRVSMASTNADINLSNGHVTKTACDAAATGQYGVDYMDAITLDQVMLSKHPEITHVNAIKVDVETFEVHVINGAMRFLCSRIVDTILMEVEYIKTTENAHGCSGSSMQNTLITMGFEIKDEGNKDVTGLKFQNLPGNVVFQQKYRDQPPGERLRGQPNSPCGPFVTSTAIHSGTA